MGSIDDKPEAEMAEGDVAVPANAAVAANVLAGALLKPEAHTDQGQPADLVPLEES